MKYVTIRFSGKEHSVFFLFLKHPDTFFETGCFFPVTWTLYGLGLIIFD